MALVHPPTPPDPRPDPLIPSRTSVSHVSPGAPLIIPKRPQTPSTVTGTFIGLCKTLAARSTAMQLCVWNGLIGLAQAAAVHQSSGSQTPAPGSKTTDLLLPVILSVLLVASLVAVWWAHWRATRHIADQGAQAPRTPSQHSPLSIPSPVYLTSRPPYVVFNMHNALIAPIVTERLRSHWANTEIVLAGLSVILTAIGLVLTGLSLLYAQRAVPKV